MDLAPPPLHYDSQLFLELQNDAAVAANDLNKIGGARLDASPSGIL